MSRELNREEPLKHIAVLLTKLSYRDMQLLSADLATFYKDAGGDQSEGNMATAILTVADRLLTQGSARPKQTMREASPHMMIGSSPTAERLEGRRVFPGEGVR